MPSMYYNEKLKTAMAEIKDILSKYDIAGIVLLHTPGGGESLAKLDPTYSCMKVRGDEIIFKATLEDFNDDKQAWIDAMNKTSNMLGILLKEGAKIMYPLAGLDQDIQNQFKRDNPAPDQNDNPIQNN